MSSLADTLTNVGMTSSTPTTDGRSKTYEIADTSDDQHELFLAKKRAMMDARMKKRNDKREQLDVERQKERADNADPNNSMEKFWQEYKALQKQVQDPIDAALTFLAETPTPTTADKQTYATSLQPLAQTLDSMQKMAAGAAYYLPPYDSRSAAVTLRALRTSLTTTKEQLTPKKKFSFKEKRAAAKAAKAAKKLLKEQEQALHKDTAVVPAPTETKHKVARAAAAYAVVDYIVSDKTGETITVDPGALDKWAKEEAADASSGSSSSSSSSTTTTTTPPQQQQQ